MNWPKKLLIECVSINLKLVTVQRDSFNILCYYFERSVILNMIFSKQSGIKTFRLFRICDFRNILNQKCLEYLIQNMFMLSNISFEYRISLHMPFSIFETFDCFRMYYFRNNLYQKPFEYFSIEPLWSKMFRTFHLRNVYTYGYFDRVLHLKIFSF